MSGCSPPAATGRQSSGTEGYAPRYGGGRPPASTTLEEINMMTVHRLGGDLFAIPLADGKYLLDDADAAADDFGL